MNNDQRPEPGQTSTLFCENVEWLLAVNYFCKKAPSQLDV